jgi:hypothetical protein
LLLSDSETLDEGFETQSNVSETVEPTPRSCPIETISNEINETKSAPIEETLADELTQRLTFTTTRRLSHDSSLRHNNKRTSISNGRSTGLLKTSTSAYSYPTFTSIGQQNQANNAVTKRTPSVESLRLTSTNNNTAALLLRSSRHIQRCAVSRRIWNEKDTDDTSKNLATSPPPPPPSVSTEPDEVSSSSTVTTTTTTTITSTATTANRRLAATKPKSKIRNLNSLTGASSPRSNSPIIRKVPPRLSHASSCQNVSNTTNNSPKSSPLTKTRSPPSFFLNSSQVHRSTFSRPTEKPLRALHIPTNINNESSSPRTRRLFSSNNDLTSASTSSPKSPRKPPSSWHHQKSLANKTSPLTTAIHSSNLTVNRKTSTSTIDLHKINSLNNPNLQRLTQSKRL